MMDTLVLSTAYQPMRYVDWREAFCLWFSGRVEVIEFYKDKVINTVSETFNVPSIIRFVKGVIKRSRQSKVAKFSRVNVMLRDNYECQYCKIKLDKKTFTMDHVIPVSQGGKTNWRNIVSCCIECNQKKKNRTPTQAGMKLVKEPYVPDNFEIFNKSQRKQEIPAEWKDYVGGLL
jgi:5-methylcytosine-specific restriction endonuclease McrA